MLWVVISLLLGLGSGCQGDPNGGDSGGDPDPTAIAASDFCAELTEVLCDGDHECCTDSGRRYDSVSDCERAEIGNCLDMLFTDSRTGYDGRIAFEILGTFDELITTCDLGVTAWLASTEGPLSILQGTVASGGDCSPRDFADKPAGAACRLPAVCKFSSKFLGLAGTCGTYSALGGHCFTDLECVPGLRCDPHENWLFGGGTCTERLPLGLSCGREGDCETINCENGVCARVTANSAYCLR